MLDAISLIERSFFPLKLYMKGGIYSIDGSEVCEHSMDITFKDEDDEPPTKKVSPSFRT